MSFIFELWMNSIYGFSNLFLCQKVLQFVHLEVYMRVYYQLLVVFVCFLSVWFSSQCYKTFFVGNF